MKKAAIATATAGIAVTAFAAPTIASASTVIVQAGDTLWGIAQKAGTDVDSIKKANKLTSDTIYPGQKLEVNKVTEETKKAVNATWLNVRQGPSADNNIITSIKGGTQVTVETTEANGWNKVVYEDGKSGYVNGKYLSDITAVAPVVEAEEAPSTPAKEEVNEQKTETPVAPKAEAEATQPAAEQEVTANATTHKVKSGDTLWALSTKYGVSVQDLIAWNNLSSSSIYVGQTLAVNQSEAQAPAAPEKEEVTAPVVKDEAPETVTETAPPAKEEVKEEAKEETPAPVAPPKLEQNEAPVVQVDTNASTYTVQSGDSLSKIATLFGTSVANLKAINSLTDDNIVVGDVLKVKGSAPVKETVNKPDTEKPVVTPEVSKPDTNTTTNVNKPSTPNKPAVNTSNTSNYTVQSGDSYFTIAQKFGTTVANLKALNNASSDNLQVGDVLKVKGTASNVNKPSTSNNNNSNSNSNANTGNSNNNSNSNSSSGTASFSALMNEAQKHLGKPYSWGGNGPSSFDCSGYTKYVFAKQGISIPRTSGSQYAASTKVSASQAQPGDLVFFDYGSGIAHVGIYIGGGQMINAQNDGVKIDNVTSGYWAKYLVGYGKVANF
ncbi:LysM peptidoglycan-binding domain-containing protein [Listeria sp. SHR_NRA_18]|uniref:LysM peptidoglycan-binding domain-containing protein n=1 Tax=Listeria sp. SHR_NRA_18 TaxID=2269046 RepID=UPI00051D308E|nr:LysM peptidoglycan-binding domain-containing protein [Listeria sp. SHR_NRA_18]KGL39185.1 peptidase [Listeriaceae bacterium FSL A5-0209]RQW66405.1 LysM peptidoglycan-binding domain-containing protein [Listeria sp. SHR_NRA_18]